MKRVQRSGKGRERKRRSGEDWKGCTVGQYFCYFYICKNSRGQIIFCTGVGGHLVLVLAPNFLLHISLTSSPTNRITTGMAFEPGRLPVLVIPVRASKTGNHNHNDRSFHDSNNEHRQIIDIIIKHVETPLIDEGRRVIGLKIDANTTTV